MKTNFQTSFCALKMMIKIYYSSNDKQTYNYNKLASCVETSRYNPIFNNVVKHLISKGAIIIVDVDGKEKIFKMKTDMIMDSIENSVYFKEIAEYIKKTRIIWDNI